MTKTRKTTDFKKIGLAAGCALLLCLILGVSSQMRSENTSSGVTSGIVTTAKPEESTTNEIAEDKVEEKSTITTYQVVSVVDGDTIKVEYEGQTTSVRLIGVNTPETVDPRKDVECFGQEASQYLKNKLEGKTITLETDDSQTDRDKYDRLLRYVYLDGEDVNLALIENGYGYEYTYNVPYRKQAQYKDAQTAAESNKRGLWADGVCVKAESTTTTTAATSKPAGSTSTTAKPNTTTGNSKPATPTQSKPQTTTNTAKPTTSTSKPVTSTGTSSQKCNIKGNISSSGEKIYHVPGGASYNKTVIDTSKGERWFCSEAEAVKAGWRRAKR